MNLGFLNIHLLVSHGKRWKVEDLSLGFGRVTNERTNGTRVADDTVKITRVTTLSALDNCFPLRLSGRFKTVANYTFRSSIFFVLDYTVCLYSIIISYLGITCREDEADYSCSTLVTLLLRADRY